jgi:hypothetical protein
MRTKLFLPARDLRCRDLHKTAALYRQEVAWWEHLHVDHWKYSMVDVMVVYITRNLLFAYMVDVSVDSLVNDS